MIERNTNHSYLGCGTALWVGRQNDGYEELFYATKEDFEEKSARILMVATVNDIDFVVHEDNQVPEFMPENDEEKIRIVFEKESRRIVVAQLASKHDISLAIHMFSLTIKNEVTYNELK